MSKWIDPNDRLPECDEEVLITVKAGTDLEDYGETTTEEVWQAVFHSEGWCRNFTLWNDVELTGEVLAWMPLPEPYKGVEK